MARLTVAVEVTAEEFAQGWNSDMDEFAASARATLHELIGDDGGAYQPTITIFAGGTVINARWVPPSS
jgi:hypothetical protein